MNIVIDMNLSPQWAAVFVEKGTVQFIGRRLALRMQLIKKCGLEGLSLFLLDCINGFDKFTVKG